MLRQAERRLRDMHARLPNVFIGRHTGGVGNLGGLVVWIVELGGDPDVLPLGAVGVTEHLVEGLAHLLVVRVGVRAVDVAVAHLQCVLHRVLNIT